MYGLAGKRVLVTAGGAGIGRAIAGAFLADGARVWICDIDADALHDTRSAHPELHGSRTDVADEAAVDAMFEALEQAFGGLDVLINNAGIAGPTGPTRPSIPPPGGAASRSTWTAPSCARVARRRCSRRRAAARWSTSPPPPGSWAIRCAHPTPRPNGR
jgi:NAD(P)-dependent dehydrogenase (short-subunit alcohol dehydrogenase family)